MKVGIVMGSDSDLPVMRKAADQLKEFGVEYEMVIASAHRTPQAVHDFVARLEAEGAVAFISGAGAAAHLPGVIASYTTLPVIGVPLNATALKGIDALLAIVQMPSGMPVATMAIDGAKNAALLAVQMAAIKDADLAKKYKAFRKEQADKVLAKNKKLQEELNQ
ncbi:MAG: 5-(carboxyamino)imidazole ribonucleotide mutase [Veillonellaceae bacterium]|nr:5-(carboxyamino)imidazole ribonucleotide mutase [Veillonellaceae bacterium]